MLEQNNGSYPLPVSMSNMLAYLFPTTARAYWDQVLEHAFAANQQRLGSAKLGLPTALVAPIMFVLDLLCSAGLVLFALVYSLQFDSAVYSLLSSDNYHTWYHICKLKHAHTLAQV